MLPRPVKIAFVSFFAFRFAGRKRKRQWIFVALSITKRKRNCPIPFRLYRLFRIYKIYYNYIYNYKPDHNWLLDNLYIMVVLIAWNSYLNFLYIYFNFFGHYILTICTDNSLESYLKHNCHYFVSLRICVFKNETQTQEKFSCVH